MHNLFNLRFPAKPAHEQAQHSEEKCLCRTFWKISLDLGWPEEAQRDVCERGKKKTRCHTPFPCGHGDYLLCGLM